MRAPPQVLHPFDALPAVLWPSGAARPSGCPRCGATSLQGWGSFRGRRRYRCNGCRRTFSDLTGTPAAYCKKLALWGRYARCLAHGLSVRRAAAQVHVHPSTAFRWRHAMLDGLRAADRERLSGWIALHSLRFPYSEKGRRDVAAPRARAPARLWTGADGVNVLVACDRRGRVVTAVAERSWAWRIGTDALARALAARLHGRPILTAREPKHGPAGRLARRRGLTFHSARGPRAEAVRVYARVDHAVAYGWRLQDWMRRFCGVATRYLPNYLVWHRAVDLRWRLAHPPAPTHTAAPRTRAKQPSTVAR
jgi:transposase-like protein